MKKPLLLFPTILIMALSCQSPQEKSGDLAITEETVAGSFGKTVAETGAVSIEAMFSQLEEKDDFKGKVVTEIREVCTKKGCWLTVSLPDGNEMRVTFKDYGFFVPTTSQGFPLILEGTAQKSVTDVETLRHYAEDAGKSDEEIEAITTPKEEFTFEAVGVLIKEKV